MIAATTALQLVRVKARTRLGRCLTTTQTTKKELTRRVLRRIWCLCLPSSTSWTLLTRRQDNSVPIQRREPSLERTHVSSNGHARKKVRIESEDGVAMVRPSILSHQLD
jgi:hypothetical protein